MEDTQTEEMAEDICNAIVVHEDFAQAASRAGGQPANELLWQGEAGIAKVVAIFGAGIVSLPVLAHIAGVQESRCLRYKAHPERASMAGGLLDRSDLVRKFGQLDPSSLKEIVFHGLENNTDAALQAHLRTMSGEELQSEVMHLQEWRSQVTSRIRILERRKACTVLGVLRDAGPDVVRQVFKRKALELHPDKGGDIERFQLLQDMKDLLLEAASAGQAGANHEDASARRKGKSTDNGRTSKDPSAGGGDGKKNTSNDPEGDDDDWFSDSDLSDQDVYDANEEFRKMFPRRKRRNYRQRQGDEAGEADVDVSSLDLAAERPKLEATWRKLHRAILDIVASAERLAEELRNAELQESGLSPSKVALRSLQTFIDCSVKVELRKLKDGDVVGAKRLFRNFVDHGCELICASGAVDADSTVREVSMKVIWPLLAKAPELEKRCSLLLDAIQQLPSSCSAFIKDFDAGLHCRRSKESQETGSVKREDEETGGEGSEETDLGKDDKELSEAGAAGVDGDDDGDDDWFGDFFTTTEVPLQPPSDSNVSQEAKLASGPVQQSLAKVRLPEGQLQNLRTEWDADWTHSCAGERRQDGSAIFCFPCDRWIPVVAPYDARGFDAHCLQEGHTDWID